MKNTRIFIQFLVVNFSIYLNRHDFVKKKLPRKGYAKHSLPETPKEGMKNKNLASDNDRVVVIDMLTKKKCNIETALAKSAEITIA